MTNSNGFNNKHTSKILEAPEKIIVDRRARFFKELALFIVVIGFAALSYIALTSTAFTAEEKKWVVAIVCGFTCGMIVYLARKTR